jgi:hypothetical protein
MLQRAPVISLLHPATRTKPSSGFPRGWRAACEQFFRSCKEPRNVEYVLIVHESRWVEFLANEFSVSDLPWVPCSVAGGPPSTLVFHVSPWGWVKIVRYAGRDCTMDALLEGSRNATASLRVAMTDSLIAPQHWDAGVLTLRELKRQFGDWVQEYAEVAS